MQRELIAVIAVGLALGVAAAHAEPTLTYVDGTSWKQAEIATTHAEQYRPARSAKDDHAAHIYNFNP
jgi:hypothetical protein